MVKKKGEPSQEFLEKKQLLDLKAKYGKLDHEYRMTELAQVRNNDILRHQESALLQDKKEKAIQEGWDRRDRKGY